MMGQAHRKQGQGRGDAPRQTIGQQRGAPTANQQMSFEQRADEVLMAIGRQRAMIEQVMPANIGFDRFLATLQTAFRHNPDILRCTTASIVQAVCKAAYDGLQLDNVEAALVPQKIKYKDPETGNWGERLIARYNPMVRGLRKQIVQGGLVDDLQVVCVFEGEPYRAVRGTTPFIEHEEKIELRGNDDNIVAAYSVAWLKNGRINFETMNREQVQRIRAIAATDYVWERNFHEMARKTVLRRHRKGLPGTSEIRDAEMQILFPQFDQTLASNQAQALPPPDRRDFGATQAAPALGAPEVHINAFTDFDQRAEELFEDRDAGQAKPAAKAQSAERQEQGKPADAKPAPAIEEPDHDEARTAPKVKVPDTPEDWKEWAARVVAEVRTMTDPAKIGERWDDERDLIDLAPESLRGAVDDAFRDQLIDVAGDEGEKEPVQASLEIEGEED
jgi:phage RecT family recombinase